MIQENERTKRITVMCSEDLKREIKRAILDKGIDKNADGYLLIMELGLKEFKKKGANA